MEANSYRHIVDRWSVVMEALHAKDPEIRDSLLAGLLTNADDAIRVVVALTEFSKDRLEETRRALAMRRTIELYLKAMGYDGAALALKRRRAQEKARDAYEARQRMKDDLRCYFRMSPEHYAAGVRYYQKQGLLRSFKQEAKTR